MKKIALFFGLGLLFGLAFQSAWAEREGQAVILLERALELRERRSEWFEDTRGVLISRVSPDSAAARAGIEVGDVLTHYAETPLNHIEDLLNAIRARAETEDKIGVRLVREDGPRQLSIAPGKMGVGLITLATPYTGDPVLALNSEMHSRVIKSLDVDAAERYLVTASEDKTVRLWSLPEGELLNTLHPPISEHQYGRLFAVAISPDGRTVATGGFTGYKQGKWVALFVYVFERETGRLFKRLGPFPEVINRLDYSADGRYLAVALARSGIRVYRADRDHELVAEDRDYSRPVLSLAFSPRGGLLTATTETIRLYSGQFELLRDIPSPASSPMSVQFSPNGEKVALAFFQQPVVKVLSADTLETLYSPAMGNLRPGEAGFAALAWSRDGGRLYAGGWWRNDNPVFVWEQGGEQGPPTPRPASNNTLMDLHALKNGGLVFASGAPAWGILDKEGRKTLERTAPIADFRDAPHALQVSGDGRQVAFSYTRGGGAPAHFDLDALRLRQGPASGLHPPRRLDFFMDGSTLRISDWRSSDPKLNGKSLFDKNQARDYGQQVYSLAVASDDKSFVLGTNFGLYSFDHQGRLRWYQSLAAAAWAVNITPDRRWVVAALGDGSLHWLDYAEGRRRLALYPHADRKRWILWRPDGYYTASVGGEDLIGWQISRDASRAGEYYPASRFRARYHDPARVLAALRPDATLESPAMNEILPPGIWVSALNKDNRFSSSPVELSYRVRNPADAPVQRIRVLLDGRPLPEARIKNLEQTAWRDDTEYRISLALPERDLQVALLAENRHAASEPATLTLRWDGLAARGRPGEAPAPVPASPKRRLLMLSVGVAAYRQPGIDKLQYPPKDAGDIAELFAGQEGNDLYDSVTVKTYPNATLSQLEEGLQWLEKNAGVYDTNLIFLAGHGYNHRKTYYFLPADGDPNNLPATGLKQQRLAETLSRLPGKVLLFLDTCHAGNVLNTGLTLAYTNRLANDLAAVENGIVVFTASTGKQLSYEYPGWENGAFTEALLEGLAGKAYPKKGRVTFKGLDFYLASRVDELVREASGNTREQTPATAIPRTIADFALTRVP